MRTFVALDIDESIRERIQRFLDGVRGFAPGARWVRAESLHMTLKFVGEKPASAVEDIKRILADVKGTPMTLIFRGTGFFPTAKSTRVFWVGVESGPELAQLAAKVDEATARVGVSREEHAFSPHLTLARAGAKSGAPRRQKGDRPNKVFARLQERLTDMPTPEFGTMTAREYYLYESKLSPGGALYTKIERYPLA
ncbi:MAG TPA: RNA 2',3'-cyclic phosphodiesterase [Terriglobales bacterium]|nr:RNA 2',3'-cyclic phosphodiesterase [Terriglobales bacterium]